MKKMKQDDKKTALRVIMFILAVCMILGFVMLPLAQSASAEEVTEVTVTSFTSGSLGSAVETAKDGTDLNNINSIKVSGGTLTAVDYEAICGYPNITLLDLSGADTENGVIPPSALASRNKLAVVYLPKNTSEIGESALYGNRSLTAVYMPATVRIIGAHAFEGCEKVEHFDIPAETEQIGASAFADCKALADFVLPVNITEIPERCFEKTALTSFIMGPQVTSIGAGAFENCHDLADIAFYGDVAPTAPTGAFQNCNVVFHAYEDAGGFDENIGDMSSGMASVVYDLDGEYKAPVSVGAPADIPAESEETAPAETAAVTESEEPKATGQKTQSTSDREPAETAAASEPQSPQSGFSTVSVIIIAVLCIAVGVFATLFFVSRKKHF